MVSTKSPLKNRSYGVVKEDIRKRGTESLVILIVVTEIDVFVDLGSGLPLSARSGSDRRDG